MTEPKQPDGSEVKVGGTSQGDGTPDGGAHGASASTDDKPKETDDSDADLRKQLADLKKENFGYREAERLRKEEELARTGKHEELINSQREEIAALKAKADRLDAIESAETAAIEKLAKEKLSKKDAEFVLSEPDLARRRVLLDRYAGSEVTPQQDPTPAASPPQATTTKPYADMTPDERKVFDKERKQAKGGPPVVAF